MWITTNQQRDNFHSGLYSLISKSDPGNRERLRMGFPEEVKAFEGWQNSVDQREFFRSDSNLSGSATPLTTEHQTATSAAVHTGALQAISERLKTQDNRVTMNPMFCVQIKVRDEGYDWEYCDTYCWRDSANDDTVYDDDADFKEPEGDEWEKFGYRDRWETVMVAFTEEGCKEYLELNGHNDRRRAHRGEVRIYVQSFNRCPEMIAIRDALMVNKA